MAIIVLCFTGGSSDDSDSSDSSSDSDSSSSDSDFSEDSEATRCFSVSDNVSDSDATVVMFSDHDVEPVD